MPRASKPIHSPMKILRGIAVSPGVAIGAALALDARGLHLPARVIPSTGVAAELERLERGLQRARAEAEAAEADARARLGPQYADILAAHASMIADPSLRRDAGQRIDRERISAEHAINDILDAHAARLEAMADGYLAARAADVRDIQARILRSLSGGARPFSPLDPPGATPAWC